MAKIERVKGCLLQALSDGDVELILSAANCYAVQGAGLALQIKEKYPDVYIKDTNFLWKGDRRKLGKILPIETKDGIVVLVYTQHHYGRDKQYTEYDAVEKGLIEVKNFIIDKKINTIGIPYKFASGLGGGDWNKIFDYITNIFSDIEIIIKIYNKESIK